MTRAAVDPTEVVREALRRVHHGDRVVLAVSGGPDSVGMAQLVVAARPDLRALVVHVRHGLRDDAADAEIAVAHARALRLPSRVIQVQVRDGSGPEDAARQARWEALAAAARDVGATAVATGHTADDQAETVLLNIARGTGLAGLSAMPPHRRLTHGVVLLRPVLPLRRDVVRACALRSGLPVAHDPTNTDPDQRRARARIDVLPRLADLTGGATDPVTALTRLAAHARRDDDALEAIAGHLLAGAAEQWGSVHAIADDLLASQHEALGSRVVRQLLARARPGYRASDAAVQTVLRLRDGKLAELPDGLVAGRGSGRLAVAPGYPAAAARTLSGDSVDLPEIGMRLDRTTEHRPGALHPWARPRTAPSAPVAAGEPVLVRPRRDGDRIATAAGVRSVAHAMAAAGIPRLARALVPVVEDSSGVLWIPGVAVRSGAAGARTLRLAPLGAE